MRCKVIDTFNATITWNKTKYTNVNRHLFLLVLFKIAISLMLNDYKNKEPISLPKFKTPR